MFGKTIGEIPGDAAAAFGDKTALIFAGKALSFAEIDRLSSRVASGLREIGVAAGDRVTLYAQNSVEWIVSYYAIAKAGGVINPINVMLTPDEVAYVVKDCGAKALFTTADRAAPIRSLKEDGHLAEIVVFGEAGRRGLLRYARRFGVGGFRAREGRPRIALDHLLHLGHHRLPQGGDAEPPVGDPQRRGDGGDEHAHEPRRAAHGAALRACLWRHADEPQLPVRLDAGALREIRRKRSLAGHPGLPRHRHRRRADDVFLHAGAPGIREIRPVLAAALGHRRADHAGRQGGGVARPRRLRGPTSCGGWTELAGPRADAALLRREPAGLGRHRDVLPPRQDRRPRGRLEGAAGGRGGRADVPGPVS